MEALLHGIAGYIALGIEAIAIAIIAAGSLEAVVGIIRTAFHSQTTSNRNGAMFGLNLRAG